MIPQIQMKAAPASENAQSAPAQSDDGKFSALMALTAGKLTGRGIKSHHKANAHANTETAGADGTAGNPAGNGPINTPGGFSLAMIHLAPLSNVSALAENSMATVDSSQAENAAADSAETAPIAGMTPFAGVPSEPTTVLYAQTFRQTTGETNGKIQTDPVLNAGDATVANPGNASSGSGNQNNAGGIHPSDPLGQTAPNAAGNSAGDTANTASSIPLSDSATGAGPIPLSAGTAGQAGPESIRVSRAADAGQALPPGIYAVQAPQAADTQTLPVQRAARTAQTMQTGQETPVFSGLDRVWAAQPLQLTQSVQPAQTPDTSRQPAIPITGSLPAEPDGSPVQPPMISAYTSPPVNTTTVGNTIPVLQQKTENNPVQDGGASLPQTPAGMTASSGSAGQITGQALKVDAENAKSEADVDTLQIPGADARQKEDKNSSTETVLTAPFQTDRVIVPVTDASSNVQKPAFRQVTDQILVNYNQNKSEFQMELYPENLGKVSVKLSMENSVLTVSILADNPKTQSLLLSHAGHIQSVLQDTVSQPVQVVDSQPKPWYQQEQGSRQQPQQQDQQQQQNQSQTPSSDNGRNKEDFLSVIQRLRMQSVLS